MFLKDIDTIYHRTLLGHLAVVFVIGFVISAAMLVIIRNVRSASAAGRQAAALTRASRRAT